MRRWLTGASTLVLASLLTGAAAAQARPGERLRIAVGGYFGGFFVVGEEDDGVGEPGFARRGHHVAREAEIHFLGSMTLDNGLKVGLDVQLEAESCVDQIDESYLYFEHEALGRLNLGSENGAAYLLSVVAPNLLQRVALSDPTFRFAQPPADTFTGGGGVTAIVTRVGLPTSGDNEKFTYISPSFFGLRLGASYTPDACEEAFGSGGPGIAAACGGTYSGFAPDSSANQFSEIIEFGARYDRAKVFGLFDLALSVGFAHSDNEAAAEGRDERQEWGFGALVNYAAWSLGGAYRRDDQGFSAQNNDRTDYSIGLRYRPGPWGLAVNYSHIRHEDGGVAGTSGADTLDQLQLEGMYALGPGIELQAGIIHYDFGDSTSLPANENRGTFFILGTFITF